MPDFSKIRVFVLDVDGVLTDGTVLSMGSGEQVRQFYVKDGYVIEHALNMGYRVTVISGGNHPGVRNRLEFLGIKEFVLGAGKKLPLLKEYIDKNNLSWEECLYMGDDMPDLEAMQACGIGACPADAATDVLALADYVSPFRGGYGAVRDVIEKTLKARGDWMGQDTSTRAR